MHSIITELIYMYLIFFGALVLIFVLADILNFLRYYRKNYWPSSVWYLRQVQANPDLYLTRPNGWYDTSGHIYWYTQPISLNEYQIRADDSDWFDILRCRSACRLRLSADNDEWIHKHPWDLHGYWVGFVANCWFLLNRFEEFRSIRILTPDR